MQCTHSKKIREKPQNHLRGFSLIEMLLSLALISLIAAVSIPVYQSFQVRNDLDITANSLAQNLRRAQTLSVASDGDSSWGMYATTSSLTLFKGNTYATRDTTFDETTSIPQNFIITGINEVTFAKLTGLPLTTGTTTFTSNIQEVRNVNINSKGMITF